MSGTLYLVATPIGNLGDFSPRAVETLSSYEGDCHSFPFYRLNEPFSRPTKW